MPPTKYSGVIYRTCGVCLGCGEVSSVRCSSCEGTGVQPTIETLTLLARTVEALDNVRRELAGSRWTMRKALDLIECGNTTHARATLAHALRLDEGPVYGGNDE